VVLVSQFLDTARFPICEDRKPQKADGRDLSLVYIGRLALEKSVDSLLQFSRCPGVTVHVVGDGPLRPKLVREYPTAQYHGFLQGGVLREAIEACDYLVLPSRTETLGLVVLEAAACGVPTILLRGEVPSEIVERYSAGVLVESFDGLDWIKTARAIRASRRYDLLVNGCRIMARSQSVEFGAKRMIDAWRHLICTS
jgi:glycosyltransferase involved in cell wall biosynthesis